MKFCEFWAKCWNPSQLFKKNGTENAIQRPNSREEVIDWYKTTQRPKNIGFNQDKTICEWFHGKLMGFISRVQHVKIQSHVVDLRTVFANSIRPSELSWSFMAFEIHIWDENGI